MVILSLGVGLVTPMLPGYMKDEFGSTDTAVGFLITFFGIMRLVMDFPAGLLADKFGRKVILCIGLSVAGTAGYLNGLAATYWQLLLFRGLQGAGSGLYMTVILTMLSDISPPDKRGKIMAVYQGSMLLGMVFGSSIGGFLTEYVSPNAPFFAFGTIAFASMFVFLIFMPETSKLAGGPVQGGHSGAAAEKPLQVLKGLLKNRDFVLIVFVAFVLFVTLTGSRQTILPLLGKYRIGLGQDKIGVAFSLDAISTLFFMILVGYLIDRFGKKNMIVGGLILSACGLLILTFAYSYMIYILGFLVFGLGRGMSGPAPAAYVMDISDKKNTGTIMGIYRMSADLGFVMGPVLMGSISDMAGSDYRYPLGFNILLLIVASVLFLFCARESCRKIVPIGGAVEE